MLRGAARPLKLYLDTSIPSFLFAADAPDKQKITELLFKPEVRNQYEFYISGVVVREVERAPASLRERLFDALEDAAILELTEEIENLAQAYLKANVLPKKSEEDARHVAVATVHNLDAVVSWNFKHLVNLRRIRLINLINEEMGYKHIEIVSPHEVIAI